MAEQGLLILRARVALPVRRPPLEDAAVLIAGNRIAAVGRWRTLRSRAKGRLVDLGDVILMPGLVNAHCHLDYTDMAGLFPPPRRFCDWIKLITTEKSQWSYSDFAQSWLNGARMLVRTGTTTVADIEAVPELLPDVWHATPLRVFSFLEMTGVRSRRTPESVLGEVVEKIESLPNGRCRAGLSPHAPYSTMPPLLKRAAAAARKHKWLVTTHVSESATEFEMFMRKRGEMFDWLRRNSREMSDCGGNSPVHHMARSGLFGRNLLAIHVNYLAKGDAALLGRKKVNVVHCPHSRDYFDHADFPYQTLAGAGVNICLGTDSLATVRKKIRSKVELSMFDEMRAFAVKNTNVPAEDIVHMATVNGARALGLRGRIGEMKSGALADLIALPFNGKGRDACDAVVRHAGGVSASMIDGRWEIAPQ
jgi:cytosine/adenosine deaminase-related metal-dependent hydrolase